MGGARWPRAEALEVARELSRRLQPVCARLVVAGSLRRRKREVGDVEILYVPREEERAVDLLETGLVSLADEEIERMVAEGVLEQRLSKAGRPAWGEKNKLARHRGGMPVDLFRTDARSWWNYLVCRTGPAASNMEIATKAQAKGYRWKPYGAGFVSQAGGREVVMGSEAAVFEFVGLPAREPWER